MHTQDKLTQDADKLRALVREAVALLKESDEHAAFAPKLHVAKVHDFLVKAGQAA